MKAKLIESAVNELRYTNLQVLAFIQALEELDTFTGPLEKAVIKNVLERHELDKLIHAKLLHK